MSFEDFIFDFSAVTRVSLHRHAAATPAGFQEARDWQTPTAKIVARKASNLNGLRKPSKTPG
jgi:hypothetical protein